MLHKTKYVLLGVFVTALGLWGLAVTIPNTFSSGEVVSAAKMNQNFQALKDAVDALEAKVASLESQLGGLSTQRAMPRATVAVRGDGSVLNSYSTTGGTISVVRDGPGAYTLSFSDEDIYYTSDLVALTPISYARACSVNSVDNNLLVDCFDLTGNPADTWFTIVLFND